MLRPRELAYLCKMTSRMLSTRSSSATSTLVGEAPGRFTHIFRSISSRRSCRGAERVGRLGTVGVEGCWMRTTGGGGFASDAMVAESKEVGLFEREGVVGRVLGVLSVLSDVVSGCGVVVAVVVVDREKEVEVKVGSASCSGCSGPECSAVAVEAEAARGRRAREGELVAVAALLVVVVVAVAGAVGAGADADPRTAASVAALPAAKGPGDGDGDGDRDAAVAVVLLS